MTTSRSGPHVQHCKVHGVQVHGVQDVNGDGSVGSGSRSRDAKKSLQRAPRFHRTTPHPAIPQSLQTVATQTQCKKVLGESSDAGSMWTFVLRKEPLKRSTLVLGLHQHTHFASSARLLARVVCIWGPAAAECPAVIYSSGPNAAHAKQSRNESDLEGKPRVITYSPKPPFMNMQTHFHTQPSWSILPPKHSVRCHRVASSAT